MQIMLSIGICFYNKSYVTGRTRWPCRLRLWKEKKLLCQITIHGGLGDFLHGVDAHALQSGAVVIPLRVDVQLTGDELQAHLGLIGFDVVLEIGLVLGFLGGVAEPAFVGHGLVGAVVSVHPGVCASV